MLKFRVFNDLTKRWKWMNTSYEEEISSPIAYGHGPPQEASNQTSGLEDNSSSGIDSGTFRITIGSEQTPIIDITTTILRDIITMLEELPNGGVGNFDLVGTDGDYSFLDEGSMYIEFVGDLAGQTVDIGIADLNLISNGNPVAPEEFAWELDSPAEPERPLNSESYLLYTDLDSKYVYVNLEYDSESSPDWQLIIGGSTGIANGSITTEKLADNAVTSAKIGNGQVGSSKLAVGAVTTGAIDALAVTTDKLANDAVTSGKIGTGQVGSDEIASNAISGGHIATDSVGVDEIADNVIINDHLQDLIISNNEIQNRTIYPQKLNVPTTNPGPGIIWDDGGVLKVGT